MTQTGNVFAYTLSTNVETLVRKYEFTSDSLHLCVSCQPEKVWWGAIDVPPCPHDEILPGKSVLGLISLQSTSV